MRFKSFDGTEIYYEHHKNQGICLVFIHGWGNDSTIWSSERQYLNRKGYATLAFDIRGHGRSEKPASPEKYSLECIAGDIHSLTQKLKLQQFVLVGHSMGGMAALKYYRLHSSKRVAALILCSTTCRSILEVKNSEKWSDVISKVMDYLLDKSKNAQMSAILKGFDLTRMKGSSDYVVFLRAIQKMPAVALISTFRAMTEYDEKDLCIQVPTLIISGEKDRIVPITESVDMYKKIKNSEFVVLKSARHSVPLNRALGEQIHRFLKGL